MPLVVFIEKAFSASSYGRTKVRIKCWYQYRTFHLDTMKNALAEYLSSKENVPEGLKSRFDTLGSKSSTRAFQWCAVRHQSFDLRRVTAILLQQKNFGPNVIY